ncbi:MAG: Zn-dependent alcohol dehydrogenase [Chloroflexota bacterium]
MKINAAVVHQHHELSVEEVELDAPKAGEVLVRIRAAGVCHSDLHTLRGELRAQPPLVLGHEGAGIVEAVGEGVTKVAPGDRVMINWLPGCQQCTKCQKGIPTLCETFPSTVLQGYLVDGTSRISSTKGAELKQFLGSSTMGDYTVVSQNGVVPIPDDVPFEVAAITGCAVMTGVGAVMNTAKVATGSSAVLIGCGGVGLCVLLGLKLAGCYPIIAVDVLESKLDFALELGATHVLNGRDEDVLDEIRKLTGGGADYVFDSVGAPPTIDQAIMAAGADSTITVTGMHDVLQPIALPVGPIIFQNKRFLGSFAGSCNPHSFLPKLLELYRGRRLDLDSLITRRYALNQIHQAFDDMEAGEVVRGVLMLE